MTNGGLTRAQRVSVSFPALFWGNLFAAGCLALAIIVRNYHEVAVMVHFKVFTIQLILSSCLLESLVASLTWLIFGTLLVSYWQPESMFERKPLVYATAIPMGFLSAGLLWLAVHYVRHRALANVQVSRMALIVTVIYTTIVAAVTLHNYMKYVQKALWVAANPEEAAAIEAAEAAANAAEFESRRKPR